MLTNMWSKFLCWFDSARDLRASICTNCTAWFCWIWSCNWILAACWVVNSFITDLFMSSMLWSSVEPLYHMNNCLGGPWDPDSPGGPKEPSPRGPGGSGEPPQGDPGGSAGPPPGIQADQGDLGPRGPYPGKPASLRDLHQGVQADQGYLFVGS